MQTTREVDAWEEEIFPTREKQGSFWSSCYGPSSNGARRLGKALPEKAKVSQARQLKTQNRSGNRELPLGWGVCLSDGQMRGSNMADLDFLSGT